MVTYSFVHVDFLLQEYYNALKCIIFHVLLFEFFDAQFRKYLFRVWCSD